jgi:hypothetical protein
VIEGCVLGCWFCSLARCKGILVLETKVRSCMLVDKGRGGGGVRAACICFTMAEVEQ